MKRSRARDKQTVLSYLKSLLCVRVELTHSLARLPQSLRQENKALRLQLTQTRTRTLKRTRMPAREPPSTPR